METAALTPQRHRINETIRLMCEIDETIEGHGGWPGAFVTGEGGATGGQ